LRARTLPVPTLLQVLTHACRCIGPRNATSPMDQPVRLMYLSVSDSACEPAPFLSPPSSLTQTHRCIGPRNATSPMSQPARLMYPSVSDGVTPSPSPCFSSFSLTHTRRCIGPGNATRPMVTPARLMYLSVFDLSLHNKERTLELFHNLSSEPSNKNTTMIPTTPTSYHQSDFHVIVNMFLHHTMKLQMLKVTVSSYFPPICRFLNCERTVCL
jgi:hypothetical protein